MLVVSNIFREMIQFDEYFLNHNHHLVTPNDGFSNGELLQKWSPYSSKRCGGWRHFIQTKCKHNIEPMSLQLNQYIYIYMGVSKNRGTPKSSMLIGFSIIFTIHFGCKIPLFLVQHPYIYLYTVDMEFIGWLSN